jgi:hypothetical protein
VRVKNNDSDIAPSPKIKPFVVSLSNHNGALRLVHPSTGSEFVNLFLSVVCKESMEEDFPPLGRFSFLYRNLAVVI